MTPERLIAVLKSMRAGLLAKHGTLLNGFRGIDADIAALQETRLNRWSGGEMRRQLEEDGWQLFSGKAQARQNRASETSSPWNARHGGVAVMVRNDLAASEVPLDSAVRKRLWETGRWLHVAVAIGDGKQVMHVMSVYGHTGAGAHVDMRLKNERLLADVLEAAAELGNVPIILAGDINVQPERSARVSNALALGGWNFRC